MLWYLWMQSTIMSAGEGRIVKRAVYIALGIDMNGKKDVLGIYVGENESAKFWLSIMNGLKNRGVVSQKNIVDTMKAIRAKLKNAEDGTVDPYKLTFVLKGMDERSIPDARDRYMNLHKAV